MLVFPLCRLLAFFFSVHPSSLVSVDRGLLNYVRLMEMCYFFFFCVFSVCGVGLMMEVGTP
jgi:hypothetical protein